MKIALIGYGYWGQIIFKYLKNHDFFELVKIFHTEKIEDDAIFTNNIYEIMNDKTIEAVYIATPVSTHFKLIEIAVQNKKYVFCEKVLVDKKEELNFIKENYLNTVIETNYIYTDSLSINYIKENLKKIGKIQYIEGEIKQFGNFYEDSDVYSTIGCHLLSSIIYIFETSKIKINFQNIVKNEKQVVKGAMKGVLKEDIVFTLNVDLLYDIKRRNIILYGEKGIIYFDPLNIKNTVKIITVNQKYSEIISTEVKNFNENDNIHLALERFKSVIKGKRKSNLEMSIKISEILLGCGREEDE